MGRFRHLSVVESVEFEQLSVGMFDDLHHAPEVGVLFVTTEHFEFPVPRNQQQRWSVFANVKQRSHVVDDRLLAVDAQLGSDGKVRDRVPAERDQTRNLISINVVCSQPAFVEPDHARQIAAR